MCGGRALCVHTCVLTWRRVRLNRALPWRGGASPPHARGRRRLEVWRSEIPGRRGKEGCFVRSPEAWTPGNRTWRRRFPPPRRVAPGQDGRSISAAALRDSRRVALSGQSGVPRQRLGFQGFLQACSVQLFTRVSPAQCGRRPPMRWFVDATARHRARVDGAPPQRVRRAKTIQRRTRTHTPLLAASLFSSSPASYPGPGALGRSPHDAKRHHDRKDGRFHCMFCLL